MTYTALGATYWYSGDYSIKWKQEGQKTTTGEAWNWFYFLPKSSPSKMESATFDRVLLSCWAVYDKSDIRMLVQRGDGEAAQFAIVQKSLIEVAEV